MNSAPIVTVFASPEEVYSAARDRIIAIAKSSISARKRFDVALSGGRTPENVYKLLADGDLPWSRIHVFFGDERNVGPTEIDSNYRMANDALLSKVPIPPTNVHRVRAEIDAERAAAEYEAELRKSFALRPGARPRLDLALLGMGADGHTASLFPGSTALAEREKLCCATRIEALKTWRITLTFPVFQNAANVLFLVCGADKAAALKQATATKVSNDTPPAGRIRPTNGAVEWYVDRAARG